ncbi:hypothetical protein MTO96_020315 [Rhipicephalus appendiculatus]
MPLLVFGLDRTWKTSNMKARIEDKVIYSPYPDITIPLLSFYTLAKERLLADPHKIALVSDGVTLTRAQLLAGMERYAVGLQQYGLLPGDRICVHLNNGAENLLAMYGCILAGGTIVLAKASLTEGELRYQAEDSDCTHIITDEQYAEKARKAVSNMKMKSLFCMGRAAGFVSVSEFSKFDERGFRDCPMADPRNSVLAVCYTSGTTGMPKGAEITHYNYVACCYTSWLHFPWGVGDVFLGTLPITHQTGMVFPMAAMLGGASCALVPAKLTPLEILDAVDKYKATAAFFFPTQLQDKGCGRRHSSKTWPPTRQERFTSAHCPMVRGYYKRPKETAELFYEEGWCKSGDAGYYDESGRLYIVERLKQMIKCMDNQVVPAELEDLLLRHYAEEIEEVSVVGVPHPDFGEAPAAAIILTEKGRQQDVLSLAEKIKATICTNLAVHKHLYGGRLLRGLISEDRDGESQQNSPGTLSFESVDMFICFS